MATSTMPPIPQTHKALVLNSTRDPFDISIVQKKSPEASPGSAVIRVLAAGVLTYGGRVYSGRKPYPYPTPLVLGSTAVGRIAGIGPDSTTLKTGQLVFFDSFIQGRDDSTSLILSGLSSGFTPGSNRLMEGEWRDSTYAEYAKVPLENCFPMNEERLLGSVQSGGLGYRLEDLMYLFNTSVAFGGLRDVDVKAGEKVIIAPATGAFGSAAVVAALSMGAQVICIGRNPETLNKVKSLGPEGRVRTVVNTGDIAADVQELTKYGPVDVFFDISPGKARSSSHYKSCVLSLRRGGRVSLMSAHEELPLPFMHITLSDITVKGKWMYTKEDIRYMISLAEAGYLKLGEAGGIKTVGVFRLEQFEEAFDTAAKMIGPCLQTIITP